MTRAPALAPVISGLLTKDPTARWRAARARQELKRLSGATPGRRRDPLGRDTRGRREFRERFRLWFRFRFRLWFRAERRIPSCRRRCWPGRTAAAAHSRCRGIDTGPGGFSGHADTPGAGTPYPGMVSTAPPTMAANAVGPMGGSGFHGGSQTPYPPQPMPFGPGPQGPGGPGLGGPGGPGPGGVFPTTPMPLPKNNTGRNVGLGIGALVLVGGIVAAIALSGGGGSSNNQNALGSGGTTSHSASAPKSSPRPRDRRRSTTGRSPRTLRRPRPTRTRRARTRPRTRRRGTRPRRT